MPIGMMIYLYGIVTLLVSLFMISINKRINSGINSEINNQTNNEIMQVGSVYSQLLSHSFKLSSSFTE